jgi:hypothetical protein
VKIQRNLNNPPQQKEGKGMKEDTETYLVEKYGTDIAVLWERLEQLQAKVDIAKKELAWVFEHDGYMRVKQALEAIEGE